jgi:hypothetical protein
MLDYDMAQSAVQRDFDSAEEPAWQAMAAASQKQPIDYQELKKTWAAFFDVWSSYTEKLRSIAAPTPMLASHVQLTNVGAQITLHRQAMLDSVAALEQGKTPSKDAIASYQSSISWLRGDLDKVSQARVTWSEAYAAFAKGFDSRKQAVYQEQSALNAQFAGL